MVRALLASAILAAVVSAAPSRYSANSYNYEATYEPCKEHQKQTWYDANGVEYGWDDKHHVACLVQKDYGYHQPSHGGYDSYTPPSYDTYTAPSYNGYDQKYQEPQYDAGYGYDHKDSYLARPRPPHRTYYYAAPAYDSYTESKCEEKYQDKNYQECTESYEYAKQHYCSQYGSSGTKHGDCVTELVKFKDQCTRAIDQHKHFCWDPKYLPEAGYYQPPKETYHEPSYGYEQPKYEEPKYEQPKYEEPKYEEPQYEQPKYEEPKYDSGYSHGGYDTYTPSYDQGYQQHEYEHKPAYFARPHANNYEQPKYEEHKYEQPKYEEHKYEQPKYEEHKYEQPKYEHGNYDCSSAKHYFESTGSPTLKQCVSIACAPGQTKAYIERALYQCYALEQQAKATNYGKIPHGW